MSKTILTLPDAIPGLAPSPLTRTSPSCEEASPASSEVRYDIIQTISFGKPEPLLAFCRGIQAGAPVDSFATPEPCAMPGYDDPVIMAAGAFIQGSSIELSCDAPMREPYTCYLQGGLTYESGMLGILRAVQEIRKLQA